MNTFVTADLHLGHDRVASDRGFGEQGSADTDAHDAMVMDRWRDTVRKDDIVYILGDIIGHKNAYRRALEIIGSLPGTKHLIAGNHDPVSPIHRDSHKFQREFLDVFESVQAYARRRIVVETPDDGAQRFNLLMSHYPYMGAGDDHTSEARYEQFRLPDCGDWLVHGHTHIEDQRVHFTDRHTGQIHIGLDAWDFAPVAEDTLRQIIADPEGSGHMTSLDILHTNGALR